MVSVEAGYTLIVLPLTLYMLITSPAAAEGKIIPWLADAVDIILYVLVNAVAVPCVLPAADTVAAMPKVTLPLAVRAVSYTHLTLPTILRV